MKNHFSDWGLFYVAVLICAGAIGFAVWVSHESPDILHSKHEAWEKASSNTNLNFHERLILHDSEMLPGQTKQETIIYPVYMR